MVFDAVTQSAFREFLGRDPHPSGDGREIMHLSMRGAPEFRFEWHPQKRKVYLVRVQADGPEIGEILAEHAETHAHALNFVQTFLRGYREGQAPGVKPHLIG